MLKFLSSATVVTLLALASPASANPFFGPDDASCVTAAEASAKQYEHEQKIIWGKMGGSIQEFKQQRYFVSGRNQCLLDVKFKIAQKGNLVTTRYIVDAFERRIYGTFYGVGASGGEAKSVTCNYGVNFNEAGQCASESEFEGVIQQLVK
jgi:hypothetical protein